MSNLTNSKYKAVIFDFDYTLVDSSQGICECVKYALLQMGYKIPENEEICKAIGMSLGEMFSAYTLNEDPEERETFRQVFKIKADEVMNLKTIIFPDAIFIADILSAAGIKCGIVSTKFRFRIIEVLEREGLAGNFDIVIGGEDVSELKPNPEGLLKAIQFLGFNREECLYVGDSIVDAKTAKNADVDFVAVLSGTTTREQFKEYPNVSIIGRLGLLKEFI